MCKLKAVELLEKRRIAAVDEDVQRGIATIQAIDEARWRHEERTGCTCWADAVSESPNPLEPRS